MNEILIRDEKPKKNEEGITILLIFLFFEFIIALALCLTRNNLLIAIGFIFLGNFFIALVTQIFHYLLGLEEHHIKNWGDATRFIAGILEMALYSFSFATGAIELIVGYLLLKSLSVWTSKDQPKEGRSTSILRVAVVLSLLLSLLPAYFLRISIFGNTSIQNFLNFSGK